MACDRTASGNAAFPAALAWVLAALLALSSAAASAAQTCPAGNELTTPDADLVDNQDGTITHTKTNLMWKRCPEGLGGSDCTTGTASTFTWADAQAAAFRANLEYFASYNDWRLPNLKELQSIVESGCSEPAINLTRFPNTPTVSFWSGTSYAFDFSTAWVLHFGVTVSAAGLKTDFPSPVRLVRGGQPFDSFDVSSRGCTLDVDGNGTLDALTDGLMILRAMLGLTGTAVTSNAIGGGVPSRTTWAQIRPFLNGRCGANFGP